MHAFVSTEYNFTTSSGYRCVCVTAFLIICQPAKYERCGIKSSIMFTVCCSDRPISRIINVFSCLPSFPYLCRLSLHISNWQRFPYRQKIHSEKAQMNMVIS